jgi:ABC-type molybdate transport system ATPase subunit
VKNVTIKTEGKVMTITVDLSKDFGRSGSGKTIIIASTEGATKESSPYGDVQVNLNVYKYPERG